MHCKHFQPLRKSEGYYAFHDDFITAFQNGLVKVSKHKMAASE